MYSVYFIFKETRSSVQHSHKCSTLIQVDYLQITQQYQPIYIPHNVSLHTHTMRLHSLQITLAIFPTISTTTLSLSKYELEKIHNYIKYMTENITLI